MNVYGGLSRAAYIVGPGFEGPPYTPADSEAFTTQPYRYHTFAMEWLPHEVRFLYDSVVLFRWTDHMVPPGNAYYDWVGTMSRSATEIHPAQFDLPSDTDVFGRTPGSAMYQVRAYFEHAASQVSWPGFETFDGKRAAHHMLDYVKVWDVPKNVFIPTYPH